MGQKVGYHCIPYLLLEVLKKDRKRVPGKGRKRPLAHSFASDPDADETHQN